MFEGQISAELEARLTGKVRGIGTAIPKTRGIGDGASAGKSAQLRQSADPGEVCQPMSMRQGTVRKTSVPFLTLIIGGLE